MSLAEQYKRMASREINMRENYIGEDGLRRCAKCGEVIERKAMLFNNEVSVPVNCACRRAELEKIWLDEAKKKQDKWMEDIRNRSLIVGEYATADFRKCEKRKENEVALRAACRYCSHFDKMYEAGQGLLFYGGVGTGKTYTAACIGNWIISHGYTVVMTSPARILRDVWDESASETENFEKLMRPRLLIIDDLGTERNTDFGLEKIFGVIDARVTAKKPMIVTTNLTMREMAEADIKHKRIYDRMLSVCYPIQFSGRSFRMVEAERRQKEMVEILEGDKDGGRV